MTDVLTKLATLSNVPFVVVAIQGRDALTI